MTIDYLGSDKKIIECVAQWLFGEWGFLEPGGSAERVFEELTHRVGSNEIPLTMVALENGMAVGTASLIPDDLEILPQYTPWLANVYVAPAYRSKGIGSKLCNKIISEAKRLGLKNLYLFTSDKMSFYESHGWCAIDKSTYFGKEVVVMKYDVTSSRGQ